MPVATPLYFTVGESSLFTCKKPPDKRCADHRIWRVMDKRVERVEMFVGCKWNLYAFHCKLFRPTSVGRDAAAIHRAGFFCTTVFQPNVWPRRTTRVKQTEIFKSVRHESGYLNDLVVVRRRISLKVAGCDSYRFITTYGHRKTMQ